MTPARGLALTVLAGLLAWLLLALAIGPGCAVSHTRTLELEAGRPAGPPAACPDGAAPVVLADVTCGDGCGWSCLPGRQAAPGVTTAPR